jgi:hypothetical protein
MINKTKMYMYLKWYMEVYNQGFRQQSYFDIINR